MIAYIRGVIIEKGLHSVIVDVGGIGYELLMPTNDIDRLNVGEDVQFYTYFHVRETAQELFGFASHAQKGLFELLITVSGVGPKMALAIMSLGDEGAIRQAIASGDEAYITGAAGVGKKVAQRVVVDLKDKVGVVGEYIRSGPADDVLDALLSLGYSQAQAQQALREVDGKLSVEDRIKQALKLLS